MIKWELADSGIWYTKSHKGEEVKHLFRIGTTNWQGMTIYEIIVWKLRIAWTWS
jgi:hypothetical protein